MANPQKENGYTSIANDILDALAKTRIPGEARQMLDVIIRKTYGYGKTKDMISTSQFCDATGLKKSAIQRARKRLLVSNLITVYKNDTCQILTYSFQKDYEKWIQYTKSIPVYKNDTGYKNDTHCIQKSDQTVSIIESHKRNKETITKEIYTAFERFYSKYPRKEAKQAALKAFIKLAPDNELLELMISAVDKHSKTDNWIKDNGNFIPHPATWINKRRWEDEIKTNNNRSGGVFDISPEELRKKYER